MRKRGNIVTRGFQSAGDALKEARARKAAREAGLEELAIKSLRASYRANNARELMNRLKGKVEQNKAVQQKIRQLRTRGRASEIDSLLDKEVEKIIQAEIAKLRKNAA